MEGLSLLANMAIVLVAALIGGMVARRLKLPVILGYLAVRNALRINPKLDVVARVHGDEEVEALRDMGVAELVHLEFEAGLEIVRHTLHRFGLTTCKIQYIVNSLRGEGLT